jgi:hypothetical protein
MMVTEEYLRRSRLFRRLKSRPHGQHVERYAARLVEDGRARHGTWRCLHLVGDLLNLSIGTQKGPPIGVQKGPLSLRIV